MKTEINLEDFDFGKARLVHQISDEPNTGFACVMIVWGAEINSRADFIKIDAELIFINTNTNQIVKQMGIYPTKLDGKDWIIENDEQTIALDSDLNPIPNPEFNAEEEITDDNFPYLKDFAFNVYAEKCFEALTPLLILGIDRDDSNNRFHV